MELKGVILHYNDKRGLDSILKIKGVLPTRPINCCLPSIQLCLYTSLSYISLVLLHNFIVFGWNHLVPKFIGEVCVFWQYHDTSHVLSKIIYRTLLWSRYAGMGNQWFSTSMSKREPSGISLTLKTSLDNIVSFLAKAPWKSSGRPFSILGNKSVIFTSYP